MWGRRKPANIKNYEPPCRSTEERINESLAKEQKSQETQLKLWKDRPRLANEEIPAKVFQTLQKQHNIREDNG